MKRGGVDLPPLGGEGETVEADETYYGPIERAKVRTETTSGRPYTKSGIWSLRSSGRSLGGVRRRRRKAIDREFEAMMADLAA
jgi:hypothetical protein